MQARLKITLARKNERAITIITRPEARLKKANQACLLACLLVLVLVLVPVLVLVLDIGSWGKALALDPIDTATADLPLGDSFFSLLP